MDRLHYFLIHIVAWSFKAEFKLKNKKKELSLMVIASISFLFFFFLSPHSKLMRLFYFFV